MRAERPSRTAAWVAAARGLGVLLPDDVRLAEDAYGTAFASPRLKRFVDGARARGSSALATMPAVGEWVIYMQVRTRLLDDAVRAFAAAGGRQVVILGAGYDCRALRLDELRGAAVYEIDHPATQRRKQDVLARIGAESPVQGNTDRHKAPARLIAWDFEARPMSELGAALAAAGHDPARPTITLWEGVTMYLSERAIEDSVRAIAGYSAPGSRLAMTYFDRARLSRPPLPARAVSALVARVGEPWRWGWAPDELPAWMAARGFTVERDLSLPDAARALLPESLARRIVDPHSRVAVALRESVVYASTNHQQSRFDPGRTGH